MVVVFILSNTIKILNDTLLIYSKVFFSIVACIRKALHNREDLTNLWRKNKVGGGGFEQRFWELDIDLEKSENCKKIDNKGSV